MSHISTEKMQGYILSARKREQQVLESRRERQRQAMAVARIASELLREEYRVSQVVVFGSLVSGSFAVAEGNRFGEASDIDLAVRDLPDRRYYQAVGKLQGLSEFAIDLVRVETASGELLEAINQGMVLLNQSL